MGVLGTANNSLIVGVLVLRGQDYKPVVGVAPDWESYDYKKLDISGSDEDRNFFEAALAWDMSIDGKTWADGKNVSRSSINCLIFTDNALVPIVQMNYKQLLYMRYCPRGCSSLDITLLTAEAFSLYGFRSARWPPVPCIAIT